MDVFAEQIGVTPISLSRYFSGVRKPSAEIMERIHRATGGAVTPNDFFNLSDKGEAA